MRAGMNGTPYSEGFARRLAKMTAKPIIDVQVYDHCNLRRAGCLHFAPLAEQRFLDLDKYERDLERLASIEGIGGYFDTVVLMGPAPLGDATRSSLAAPFGLARWLPYMVTSRGALGLT